ncbi:MAG: TIR domain-containing protein [Magnetococcales bacterium]|nr:TIR domain-containing protein [Magnetococcales bacterium]
MSRLQVFISHGWEYSEDYEFVKQTITKGFADFVDYSDSKENPIAPPNQRILNKEMLRIIDERIRSCSLFVVLGGMYAKHSDWIEKEVNIALKYNKSVLVVRPRNQQMVPVFLQNNATEMVNYYGPSIIDAIKKLLGRS